jgi:hypothetical protein
MESVTAWLNTLEQSNNEKISNAAQSPQVWPVLAVELKEGSDMKTPDCSIMHECKHDCPYPTLILEVSWTESKEELQRKADAYSTNFLELPLCT